MFDRDDEPKQDTGIIKKIWRWSLTLIKGYLIMIGIMTTVLFLALSSLLSKCNSTASLSVAKTNTPSVLHLNLDTSISDSPLGFEQQIFARLFGSELPIDMGDLRAALRRAAKDPAITSVLLQLEGVVADLALYSELRRALQTFKESGKKIHVWSGSMDTETYYLASVADRVNIAPAGSLMITGPVFQMVYFGDALRKLGVDVEVIRAGKFKSAFEPFITNDPSPESKIVLESVEQSLRTYIAEDIAATRNASVDSVKAWLKQSIYSAADAKQQGIVDDLKFLDEVRDQLKAQAKKKDEELEFVSLKKYLRQSKDLDKKITEDSDAGLALIEVRGDIVMNAEGGGRGSRDQADPVSIRKQVEWALDQDDVKGVVLRVDSPGGSAEASDLMWHDLKRLAAKKPLVVSMGQTAASGGYYIAVAGNKIIAEANTITGSIGVIGALPNFAAFREKYGVSFHVTTQSDRAQMLNPGQKSTAFDKAIIENQIDVTYKLFLSRVADGRKMEVEKVHELAQGRIYSGRQALELGLVDDLGGTEDAFIIAKELAGLDPKKLHTVHVYEPEEHSLRQCLGDVQHMAECLSELNESSLNLALPIDAVLRKQRSRIERQFVGAIMNRDHVLMLAPMVTLQQHGTLLPSSF